jgi:hypothetical protein
VGSTPWASTYAAVAVVSCADFFYQEGQGLGSLNHLRYELSFVGLSVYSSSDWPPVSPISLRRAVQELWS